MLQIQVLPAFTDNYLWLLQDPATACCAVFDPGDAAPVLAWLAAHPEQKLSHILITHHHPDHTAGIRRLKEATDALVYGPALEKIPHVDVSLAEAQLVECLGLSWQVLHIPGHTLGHIAYYHADVAHPVLFCGDTLFLAGCGRLFEGTAAQMHHSLSRMAALPDHTKVYCTHEYSLANLRFAKTVEPDNAAIEARFLEVAALRARNEISLPTEIGLEKQTNPFLRTHLPQVQRMAQLHSASDASDPVAVFAALRSWKDGF